MLIDQQTQLNAFCNSISDATIIAIDTEFKRETTYYPELCLIQIATNDQFAIIDTLAIDDLSAVNQLFQNPNILKVLHSSSQDLEIFYHVFGELPKNIFDTQIAACVCGLRSQISFKDLILHYLDIELDKSETRSDWTKRPLSQQQLTYAQYDVTYLLQCYPLMAKHLKQLDRLHWLDGDFAELENTNKFKVDKTQLWKKVRGHQNLKKHQLVWLNQLGIWRESIAIDKNVPRRNAIKDDCLLKAAQIDKQDIYTMPCLQTFLSNPSYQQQLTNIIDENFQSQIKAHYAVKLTPEEKKCFDQCLETLAKESDRLQIDLKTYIRHNKIKGRIKHKVATPPPCANSNVLMSWKDHAIYIPIDIVINQ
jgi:ribonuclease D